MLILKLMSISLRVSIMIGSRCEFWVEKTGVLNVLIGKMSMGIKLAMMECKDFLFFISFFDVRNRFNGLPLRSGICLAPFG